MNEKQFIKIIWAVKALLIVVLIYAGFQAIAAHLHLGRILDPDAVSGDEGTPGEQAATPQVDSPRDYSAIVQRNLFTGADRIAPQTGRNRSQTLDSMASAEELGLKLIGAIAGGPAASRAIIQNTQNNTINPYRIGDAVASATLESIQRDAVILRHQGRQLVLRLHTGTGGDKNGGASPKSGEQSATPASPRPGAAVPLSTQAGYLEEVFRKVKIEPYVKNSQTQGLRVSGLEKVPMAELFGLKNGDVIQTINGQQLTSKQKAFQVLMKAKSQSRVDIQLLRDGKNKDLSFEI
jgi:type II secretion system protein C